MTGSRNAKVIGSGQFLSTFQARCGRLDRRWVIIVAIGLGLCVAVPYTVDFGVFYDGASRLLTGQNPYARAGYVHPIQAAILLSPLTLLPLDMAYRVHAGLAFVIFVSAMWRLLDRRWDLTFLSLLSPFAWLVVFYGNIDYLVLLGATLPPPIGLWLVLAKPQMGFVAAAVMVLEEQRAHGWRRALLISAPLLPIVAVAIWAGINQPGGMGRPWNISLWPWGLAVGMPLALVAVKRSDRKMGLLASTFLAPYVTALNWSGAMPALMRSRRGVIGAAALGWIIFWIWRSRL